MKRIIRIRKRNPSDHRERAILGHQLRRIGRNPYSATRTHPIYGRVGGRVVQVGWSDKRGKSEDRVTRKEIKRARQLGE